MITNFKFDEKKIEFDEKNVGGTTLKRLRQRETFSRTVFCDGKVNNKSFVKNLGENLKNRT